VVEGSAIIDLFSGCGGFSLGAELAGFRSIAAIDIDPTLQSGFRRNFPKAKAIEGSVADIDASAWRHFIGNIRPDGIIGGPPCQGFSRIGKKQKDDPRNSLIHHFYRHVLLLKPKFFVMENVEGLLDADSVETLNDAISSVSSRYKVVGPFKVNAADFGAATNRQRVVVFGYDPSEVDPLDAAHLKSRSVATATTVRQAIADLPSPISEVKAQIDFGWARYPNQALHRLSDYARQMRERPRSGLGWAEAIERSKQGFVSGLVETRHSADVARRYTTTRNGKTDETTKSYRLEWDGQCPTLRAGTGPDKGSFQAVRPLHPGEGRVITVREAARLQGFPDWFVFHPTKWHSFRMIGNSVSPTVSQGLMSSIAEKCI